MSTTLNSRVAENAVAVASFNAPLGIGASKSAILRYVVAKGAGRSEREATQIALNAKSRATLSESSDVGFRVPDDLASEIVARFPGRSHAWIVRYLLALECDYSDDQAEDIASTDRRKKSEKDAPR